MKKHLLIVEDEAILFRRLRIFLEEQNFEVAPYTPSVDEALNRIEQRSPDLVLLDINLQGDRSGIDLGKILQNQYDIPFLYVTEHNDEHTFIEAFATNMEDFMVKTKPVLDKKELLRKILIILKRQEGKNASKAKGIVVLTDYLKELKNSGKMQVSEVILNYEDIIYLTTDKNSLPKKLQIIPNYVWVKNKENKIYMLPGSLSKLENKLPHHFVRINEKYIVNILSPVFKGKVNGKFLNYDNQVLKITDTFKTKFNRRLNFYYQNGKKLSR